MVKHAEDSMLNESYDSDLPSNQLTSSKASRAGGWRTSLGRGKGWRRGHEGQALVEFALAVPFLLVLLMVLVEVGFLLRTHTTVTSAVREGARIAAAAGSTDPLRLKANSTTQFEPTGLDGNTLAIGTMNIALGPDVTKVFTGGIEIYRAKSWNGGNDFSSGSVDDYNATQFLPNQTKPWAVVQNPGRSNVSTYYRNVFGRISSSQLFTTATGWDMNQSYYDTNTNNYAPCSREICGSFNRDQYRPLPTETIAQKEAKFLLNPWYPLYRRSCDVPLSSATIIEDDRTNEKPKYYASPSAPDWVGVRIVYGYTLQFLPNILAAFVTPNPERGLVLSDRAIKMIDPPNNAISQQDCDKPRDRYLDKTSLKTP